VEKLANRLVDMRDLYLQHRQAQESPSEDSVSFTEKSTSGVFCSFFYSVKTMFVKFHLCMRGLLNVIIKKKP